MATTPEDIGLALRLARTAQRMSQKDVADRLGVTQRTISAWELGRRRITVCDAGRYAHAVGSTLREVLPA